MASLVVIGGPNGSGKTTLSTYLVEKGRIKSEIINPDAIAKHELGGYENRIQAARLALERRNKAINSSINIAFETTFSGNTEINEIKSAKEGGYETVLYYVALNTVIDNVNRVEERHTQYGHTVDAADIARRFYKSQANLIKYLSLFNTAYLFDNSGTKRSRAAVFENGQLLWLNPKHRHHPFYKALFNPPTLLRPQG